MVYWVNHDLTSWFSTDMDVIQGLSYPPALNILPEFSHLPSPQWGNKRQYHDRRKLILTTWKFADDIILLANSDENLQTLVDKAYNASKNFGLKINILQKLKSRLQQDDHQSINHHTQHSLMIPTSKGECKKYPMEVKRSHTKLEIFRVPILSVVTYGSETWTLKNVMNSTSWYLR